MAQPTPNNLTPQLTPKQRLARSLAQVDASVPLAMETILDLAQNAQNERTRLAAAQDILDRAAITRAPELNNTGSDMPARFIAMAMGGLAQLFGGRAVDMGELTKVIEDAQNAGTPAESVEDATFEVVPFKFEGESGTLADADKRPQAQQTGRSSYVAGNAEVMEALARSNEKDRAALPGGMLSAIAGDDND